MKEPMLLFEMSKENMYDFTDISYILEKQFSDYVVSVQTSSFEGNDLIQLIVNLTPIIVPTIAGVICTYIKQIKSKRIKIKYKGMDISAMMKENITADELINILEAINNEDND